MRRLRGRLGIGRRRTIALRRLSDLLRGYLALRTPGEDLRAYFARTSDETLREHLAGAVVKAVERDAAPVGGRHVADA